MALSAPVMIGRSNCFGFGFSTVIRKPLYLLAVELWSLYQLAWYQFFYRSRTTASLKTNLSFGSTSLTLGHLLTEFLVERKVVLFLFFWPHWHCNGIACLYQSCTHRGSNMESLMTWGLELHHFSTFQRVETTYETFSERCIFDSDYRLKVDVLTLSLSSCVNFFRPCFSLINCYLRVVLPPPRTSYHRITSHQSGQSSLWATDHVAEYLEFDLNQKSYQNVLFEFWSRL